jgi:transposase
VVDVVYPRCCGLDGHEQTAVACVVVSSDGPVPRKEARTFTTMLPDLRARAVRLAAEDVTHVALESTGVYRKPLWNVLEDRFDLLLVNPGHVKAVPGRKTDVKDAVPVPGSPLADLLRHGLLRASLVPAPPQRELRDLTRLRTTRVRSRAAEVNRLRKTLEGTNLKLGVVVSDIQGVSAQAMLRAIVAGQTDPAALADLAKGRLRSKRAELERALAAVPSAHHRFLIAEHPALIADLDEAVARLDALIAERLAAETTALERLQTIPGVGPEVAEGLLAEVGTDMSRFPTAKHLASWAALCPGNHESAGCPLGDAPEWTDAQGQHVAADAAVRGGEGGRAQERDPPGGPLPSVGGAPGREEGDDRGGPQHPGRGVLPAARRHDLRGARGRRLRRARPARHPPPPRPAPGTSRLPRHRRTRGRRLSRRSPSPTATFSEQLL